MLQYSSSGRLILPALNLNWVGEPPVELGYGLAGASPSRYQEYCRCLTRLRIAPNCQLYIRKS